MDKHHVAGKNNHPATVEIPVNDHRAELTRAQKDWPTRTLENPDQSPLRRAAASIRGFVDMQSYLIERFLSIQPENLEKLDAEMTEMLGAKWWQKLRKGGDSVD
jgi:hypothetical protein